MQGHFPHFRFIILCSILVYFIGQLSCAARGRPGGGPKDTTPPVIVETDPKPDSTGLENLNEILIVFSERMNTGSVESSIFVSPPLEYDIDWSGMDELTIELKDSLRKNQTYVMTIGSGAMDIQKNRLEDSFQFAFSTGEKLDRGEIYGRVYKTNAKDVYYIYAYKKVNPDSLNPTMVKADFLSQPGPDGSFRLKYLPDSEYRVFVVEDQNKNLLLDASYERVGIPIRDANIDSISGPAGPLNFQVTRIDTTIPQVSGARTIDNRTILLRINEFVNSLLPENISIIDTLSEKPFNLLAIARNTAEPKQFYVYTSLQDSGCGYRIFIDHLEDTLGNVQTDTQWVDIIGNAKEDTTHFEILKVFPPDSTRNLGLSTTISVEFSIPVDNKNIEQHLLIMDKDSQKVGGNWSWHNLKKGLFKPHADYNPGGEYHYHFNTKDFTSLWGDTLSDSTYYNTFFIQPEDDFGSVSGLYRTGKLPENRVYLKTLSIESRGPGYTVIIDESNNFFIPWVLEGRYKMSGFIDLNNDGKYSYGSLFPFSFSEPFIFYDDTLRVRKRWELSDIEFYIPE